VSLLAVRAPFAFRYDVTDIGREFDMLSIMRERFVAQQQLDVSLD
jgi:hypothetical protein